MDKYPLIESLFRFVKRKDDSINYYISRTLLDNIKKVEDFTIDEISKLSYCSKASIVRFCKILNTDGYRELAKSLTIQYNNFSRSNMQNSELEILLLRNSTDLVVETIQKLEEWNFLSIVKIARLMNVATKIYLFGDKEDFPVCELFKNYLNSFEIDVYSFSESCVDLESIQKEDKKSVAIIFSYFGENNNLIKTYEKLLKWGVQVVLFTSNDKSPMFSLHGINILTCISDFNKQDHPNSLVSFVYIMSQIVNLMKNTKKLLFK